MLCAGAGKFVTSRAHFVAPPGPVAPGMAIGLLGGSFNPAHEGHRHISDVALKRLGLDYVWWLVSPQNPLKPVSGMAPLPKRLSLARALAKHPRIVVTGIENALGTRYTIDTVRMLRRRFPQVHFVWLMGSDNLESFHRWRDWQAIGAELPIAVVIRPGTALAPLRSRAAQRFRPSLVASPAGFARARPPALVVLDGPRNAASATRIRAANGPGEALVAPRPAC